MASYISIYTANNECDLGTDGCAQICMPGTPGITNYTCSCIDGYSLGSDNHTCDGKLTQH